MMSSPSLLVVILNYKTPEMTLKAVAAALREMEGLNGRLIVVDNDSQDGSFEQISDEVSTRGWDVEVLNSRCNGGFGAGNNFGIRAGFSREVPDYVYILNSDAFVDKGAISALIAALETRPDYGIAGSYIHGPDSDPHLTTFRFPGILSELEGAARFGPISRILKNYTVPIPVPEATRKVDWLAGASMMIRSSVLQEIGMFDEAFFLYFEETDLCRRAALAGHPTLFVRESEVTHIGSVSTGMKEWTRMPQYWFASRSHYYQKNHGRIYGALATMAHVLGGVLWRLRAAIQRKPQADPDYFLRDLMLYSLRGKSKKPTVATRVISTKPQPEGEDQ